MEDFVGRAKTKQAQLLFLIQKLTEYYGERSSVFMMKARELRMRALVISLIGIAMLVVFIIYGDYHAGWIVFGVASALCSLIGAAVISCYEKNQNIAFDGMSRVTELIELRDEVRADSELLTPETAQALRRRHTSRIGILKSEYIDYQVRIGTLSVDVPAFPVEENSHGDELLDVIDEIESALVHGVIDPDEAAIEISGALEGLSH